MRNLVRNDGKRIMARILSFIRATPVDTAMHAPMPGSGSDPADGPGDGERWAGLMARAQGGDRAAYHTLLQAVTPYLRSIARRYLGAGADADDALQDMLLIVHGIRHTYEQGRPFKPWLSTIASRRCIDLLRRRAHRLQHEIETGHAAEDYPHLADDPEESAARQYTTGTVRLAVDALPQRQREAVRLLRLNELWEAAK